MSNPIRPYYDSAKAEQRQLLRAAVELAEAHPDIRRGKKPIIIRPDDETMKNLDFYIAGIGMLVKNKG